jgi:hypothetical protein
LAKGDAGDGLLAGVSGLPRGAAQIRAPAVDGQPPREAHQPGAEAIALAELAEALMSLDERLLRDVLGVFPMTQDAVRDAKDERGRLGEGRLELQFEVVGWVRAFRAH